MSCSKMNAKEAMEIRKNPLKRCNYKELGDCIDNALEKQIPKKPKIKHLGSGIEVYCPSCNESHIFMDARFGFKYCQDCGQKLDWSDK